MVSNRIVSKKKVASEYERLLFVVCLHRFVTVEFPVLFPFTLTEKGI